jgi:hypothetical protein
MTPDKIRQLTEMALSWSRVFLAASLAVWYSSGVFNVNDMWKAGLMACLPVIIRFLDVSDKTYGLGSNE